MAAAGRSAGSAEAGMAPNSARTRRSTRAASKSPTATTAISSGRYQRAWKRRSASCGKVSSVSGSPIGIRSA